MGKLISHKPHGTAKKKKKGFSLPFSHWAPAWRPALYPVCFQSRSMCLEANRNRGGKARPSSAPSPTLPTSTQGSSVSPFLQLGLFYEILFEEGVPGAKKGWKALAKLVQQPFPHLVHLYSQWPPRSQLMFCHTKPLTPFTPCAFWSTALHVALLG